MTFVSVFTDKELKVLQMLMLNINVREPFNAGMSNEDEFVLYKIYSKLEDAVKFIESNEIKTEKI